MWPFSGRFRVEQDSDGTYVASVPVLRGCHTQGNSLDQLMDRIREAIALCVEEQGGDTEDTLRS